MGSRKSEAKATLIVINQTVTPSFAEWLASFADTTGEPIELWSGNPPDEISSNVRIRLLKAYSKSSVLGRLWTWTAFTLSAMLRLLRCARKTPLLVVTNPPFMPLATWLLHKIGNQRYAILEWDIYPQILASMHLADPIQPLYRMWYALHRNAILDASLIITIGAEMAKVLADMAETQNLPLHVIPNWVDTSTIAPVPRSKNQFLSERGWPEDETIVLYSGNLGATHSIEVILDVARLLRGEARIRFVIIGDGSKRKLVEQTLIQENFPNLSLLPWQPESMLPHTLSAADIGIVTLADGYERLSMPSKTYGLLAAGTVILGISRTPNDLAATIQKFKCGANFAPDNPTGIANWILRLADDKKYLGELKQAAREAALQEFSSNVCEDKMTNVILKHLLTNS